MATETHSSARLSESVEAQLDREIEMVRGAIRMVAIGATPSMTIAGIRFGEAVIGIVRPIASSVDVSVEPIWRADDSGCDLIVRPQVR